MKLDTHQTFYQIHKGDGKKFTEQLLEISKHTLSQDEAAAWAQNLRFIAVPRELGFRTTNRQKATITAIKGEEEPSLDGTLSGNDKTGVPLNCVCEEWPKFPNQELPYLALTGIGEVQNCNHHVAVSYCWSSAGRKRHGSSSGHALQGVDGKRRQLRPSKRQRLSPRVTDSPTKAPYDVMTDRGMRRGRVGREVMDRALRYAANKALSFIWIDQECIEQDDPVQKELAIQSMHLVYRRSQYPLGLLTAKISEQRHVDALNFAIRYSFGESRLRDSDAQSEGFLGIPGRERPIHGFIRSLAEVLKVMARDRWLTRGWIMQEMVLAGEKMVFSMPYNPSLMKPDWGGDVEGELHFTLDELVPIFDDVLSSDVKAGEFNKLISTMDKRLDVGQSFYASYRKLRHLTLGTNADGEQNMDGKYRVCNPLAAVLYLEGRSNSRHGDRLAIVANLCDYAVRLNSTRLEELGFGYSTCLLAMMLLNGDITYMIEWNKAMAQPGSYGHTDHRPANLLDSHWDPPVVYSWMPAPQASLSLGLTYDEFIDNGNLALSTIMDPILQVFDPNIGEDGFRVHGWTWKISHKVNLQEFQGTLEMAWPPILEKAEQLDDFASLAVPVAKLVLDLFSAMLKAKARDLALLLWRHVVINYLGDWTESDGDAQRKSGLPPALKLSLSQLEAILLELAPRYRDHHQNSLSPQRLLRLLLTRLGKGTTATPEIEWIFNLIMAQGSLQWGRLSGDLSSTGSECQDQAIAVFDGTAEKLILTPQMRDPTQNATEKRRWMRHFRQQPGSWIVESEGSCPIAGRSIPVFKTKGMVRGLWRIGDTKPHSYIIS